MRSASTSDRPPSPLGVARPSPALLSVSIERISKNFVRKFLHTFPTHAQRIAQLLASRSEERPSKSPRSFGEARKVWSLRVPRRRTQAAPPES
jgi:hypothetical protein